MSIVWIGEPSSKNASLVGKKAANLSVLKYTHQIPAGFIIPATDFFNEEFTLLKESIITEYKKLSSYSYFPHWEVAVRSSGLVEDSDSASFAGQHKTFLCIRNQQQLIDAVMECRESSNGQLLDSYRKNMGIALEETKISVIVQEMIPAEVSGIVFSINPVTGNKDEILLNTSWGLGGSVVEGSVIPDSYTVHKKTLAIISREINEKSLMTISAEKGTQEINVPVTLQNKSSLTEIQIIEVGKLAIQLETMMETPIDAEYSFYNNNLYLLQCRPITTL
ncbi:MAG: hypothetical protein CL785_00655 [Chloroflexi bacterium]|nr:hypothetical protein [Chloroflexota bacterium]|tara:strand:+ start:22463 stop:23296 length:834 start_codon:yes stop_codon:yes gene_type:complete